MLGVSNENRGIEAMHKLLSQKYTICGIRKGTKNVSETR